MTKTDPSASRRTPRAAAGVALAIAVALAAGGAAGADEGKWILRIEPMLMDAYGHDQHVLTIHEIDRGATPQVDTKTPVNLDTGADVAYHAEFIYKWKQWGLGTDFFWFNTQQGRESRSAAAGAPGDEVVFAVADRSFTSTGPGEVLYFSILGDTDLIAWTADLYAMRTLAETPESAIHLRLGVRVADFDNDFHAAAGIRDAFGSLVDASSNYGLMPGPLVGLAGEVRRGKHLFEGYLAQSVVLADAELSGMTSDFTGSAETPSVFNQEVFHKVQDVAIPITDIRLRWTYGVTERISLGLGAHSSVWWDVPVPPGVIPGPGGNEAFLENTIVYLGWLGSVGITF
jgi:hypothetical protein